jgi:hypothetical protein
MQAGPARILIVDNPERTVSARLAPHLARPMPHALAFLNGVPNLCIELPSDADALDAPAGRRAVRRTPSATRMDAV